MKILCLHGYGMNPDVMRHQMSALMKSTNPDWEFHFLAGQVECEAAPGNSSLETDKYQVENTNFLRLPSGVELAFPGPYFCYSPDFDPVSMGAAYYLLDMEIRRKGPFDGLFGFSTGAGVIIGYLLERLAAQPDQPLPVKFAVFCSPPPPLASDPIYYNTVFGSLSVEDKKRLYSAQDEQLAKLPSPAQKPAVLAAKVLDYMEPVIRRPRKAFMNRSPIGVPCVIHPDLVKTRLPIPTLHVRAKRDNTAMKESALLIESFCAAEHLLTVEHSAIHNLPRKISEVQEVVSAMEQVAAQNQQPQARL